MLEWAAVFGTGRTPVAHREYQVGRHGGIGSEVVMAMSPASPPLVLDHRVTARRIMVTKMFRPHPGHVVDVIIPGFAKASAAEQPFSGTDGLVTRGRVGRPALGRPSRALPLGPLAYRRVQSKPDRLGFPSAEPGDHTLHR